VGQEQAIFSAARITAPAPAVPVESKGFARRIATLSLIALLVLAAVAVRTGNYYEPGDDFGYYMGMTGGLMILALLLYSSRKHFRFMRNWGATKHWFRLHMIFGIAGPTLILFHSTFRVGSLNAIVALSCMVLVASSGILGRVIYRKIHHGLYGRSATLQEVQTNLGIIGGDVKSKFHFAPNIEKRLKQFETSALSEHQGALARVGEFVAVGLRARWTYFVTGRELERIGQAHARKHGWDAAKLERRMLGGKAAIHEYLSAVIDVARFTAYERLFSLWHILHVPFVFMLVISGIVHVIAVHMY
jgi:hypothetical protein